MIKTTKKVRMRAFFALTVLAMAAILVMPHAAKGQDYKAYMTLKGGIFMPHDLSNATMDTGPAGEFAIGYLFSPFFAIEGGVGYFQTKLSFHGTDQKYEITGTPVTLTLKSMVRGENFAYSVGLGTGVYIENLETESGPVNISDSDRVMGYHLSVGYDFFIGERFYAGLEYKIQWIQTAKFMSGGAWTSFSMSGPSLLGTVGFRF